MQGISPIGANNIQKTESTSHSQNYSPVPDQDFLKSFEGLSKAVKTVHAEVGPGQIGLSNQKEVSKDKAKTIKEFEEEEILSHLQNLVKMIEKLNKNS